MKEKRKKEGGRVEFCRKRGGIEKNEKSRVRRAKKRRRRQWGERADPGDQGPEGGRHHPQAGQHVRVHKRQTQG